MHTFPFLIGSHASSALPSIHRCTADFDSETFVTASTCQGISDPTYLAASSDQTLYAIGRVSGVGAVYALKGQDILSTFPSGGNGPCHISVDARGEFLLCANYASGSVSLYVLARDGSIDSLCDFRQYTGAGFDSGDRQKGPHAHFAAFHSEREEVLVCDLGLDTVYVYELDRRSRKLRETGRSIRLPDGSGPRHLAFSAAHPGMLFVLTEMANTIFSFRFDPVNCRYVLEQQISAVYDARCGICPPSRDLMQPAGADNGSIGCAIRFTQDGKYLFVSSRLGYQSISAFFCDPGGRLRFCSRSLCGGITPRDFHVFEGSGAHEGIVHLLVANQDSDLITALSFDRRSEELSLLKMKMQVIKPTCILPIR